MEEIEPESEGSNLKVNDVLFILFKHQRKILLCAAVGIIAAFVYLESPHLYESKAKLLVRYVVDKSAIDQVDPQVKMSNGEAAINSEVEILTSWDLALQVADALGVGRLDPGGTQEDAARDIRVGLTVAAIKESNIILVSYKNSDPEVAKRVLEELVNRYFDKHLQVHRSTGAFDFVAQRAEQIRGQLHDTEEALKQLKAKAGVTSIALSGAAFTAALAKSQETLKAAEVELVEQRARVKDLETSNAGTVRSYANTAVPSLKDRDEVQRYQTLAMQMARMREREVDLLSKYTPDSRFVQVNRDQINSIQNQRREMEGKSPGLLAVAPTLELGRGSQLDVIAEKARLAALEAGTLTMESQVRGIQEQMGRITDYEMQVAELERRKEIEETSYKYFESSLEKARVDEALDPSKIPNISVVQKPSTAQEDSGRIGKIAFGLACGGLATGVAVALLLGLVLDETVKRPLELETRFNIPLWVSIPDMARHHRRAMTVSVHNADEHSSITAVQHSVRCEVRDLIRPYCEAIRDRLSLCFESKNLRRKPKFVAVSSLSEGAGTSTIARGIADALSESGEGKVLLVAMHIGHADIDTFFEGRPSYSLAEAIQTSSPLTPASDNLYLAAVAPSSARAGRIVPKKFYSLMPDLNASDFEYIVFDMAPLNQSGATLAMAGHMDKVLLVVEAEKNNRDVVKRAYAELVAANANVSAVFNKTRTYGPKWINGGV